jgi:hypothetical protein
MNQTLSSVVNFWNHVEPVIALLAFVMSFTSWILYFVSNRRKVLVRVKKYTFKQNFCLLWLSFENYSRLPISVTRLFLLFKDEVIECETIPQTVFENTSKRGEVILKHEIEKSLELPIQLDSLGAKSGFILFQSGQVHPEKPPILLTLRVCTNRGTIKKLELPLAQAHSL